VASGGTASSHVFLYGPPAAGKLTVARALADGYGLKVLDNHLSSDVALRLFDFGTRPFTELVVSLRVVLVESAAVAGIDVVSTMVFIDPVDRPLVERLVQAGSDHGATFTFVQLCPPTEVLEERVSAASRQTTAKLRDRATLRRVLQGWDCYTPINEGDLSIDNSHAPPADVAARIAEHAGLASTVSP
jgi:predicted kinase